MQIVARISRREVALEEWAAREAFLAAREAELRSALTRCTEDLTRQALVADQLRRDILTHRCAGVNALNASQSAQNHPELLPNRRETPFEGNFNPYFWPWMWWLGTVSGVSKASACFRQGAALRAQVCV